MKFLSKDEGLLVNVSYGDRQLHGDQIKGMGIFFYEGSESLL